MRRKSSIRNSLTSSLLAGALVLTGASIGQAAPLPSGKKVIKLNAVKVEGKMQKPQAFYILQRSSLNFEGLELKQSFISKIVTSVQDKPF